MFAWELENCSSALAETAKVPEWVAEPTTERLSIPVCTLTVPELTNVRLLNEAVPEPVVRLIVPVLVNVCVALP